MYWVRTRFFRTPLLRQFESVKSMIRYAPPKGTAGLARSRVSGSSREPFPPARITANTSFISNPLWYGILTTIARPEREAISAILPKFVHELHGSWQSRIGLGGQIGHPLPLPQLQDQQRPEPVAVVEAALLVLVEQLGDRLRPEIAPLEGAGGRAGPPGRSPSIRGGTSGPSGTPNPIFGRRRIGSGSKSPKTSRRIRFPRPRRNFSRRGIRAANSTTR